MWNTHTRWRSIPPGRFYRVNVSQIGSFLKRTYRWGRMSTCPRADAQGRYGPCVFNHFSGSSYVLKLSLMKLRESLTRWDEPRSDCWEKTKKKPLFASPRTWRRRGHHNLWQSLWNVLVCGAIGDLQLRRVAGNTIITMVTQLGHICNSASVVWS